MDDTSLHEFSLVVQKITVTKLPPPCRVENVSWGFFCHASTFGSHQNHPNWIFLTRKPTLRHLLTSSVLCSRANCKRSICDEATENLVDAFCFPISICEVLDLLGRPLYGTRSNFLQTCLSNRFEERLGVFKPRIQLCHSFCALLTLRYASESYTELGQQFYILWSEYSIVDKYIYLSSLLE